MGKIPDDMLFYYNTIDGETYYFSVYYSVNTNGIFLAEIEMEDFWSLVKDGNLLLTEISPVDFPYPIPATISGDVKAFII